MEKNFDSWIHQQHSALRSPSQNCMSPSLIPGLENAVPAYAKHHIGMGSANETLPLPGLAFPELGHLKTAQPVEPHGWFYCLPRHRQAAFSPLDCIAKDKFSAFPEGCLGQVASAPNAEPAYVQMQYPSPASFAPPNCISKRKFSAFSNGFFNQVAVAPNAEPASVQKQFLVFDHSGNQTSFFISSVVAPTIPFQHQSCQIPSCFDANGIHTLAASSDPNYESGPAIVSDGLDEDHKSDGGSEMREDTEELNALLYSDDEYEDTGCSEEDDEVASTGHSPSEMTGYEKQEEEEVASSGGPNKRRKLLDGARESTHSVMDTANSAQAEGVLLEYEDDAESSCTRGRTPVAEMGESVLGQKQSRKERIRETVSILQSIIPCGKGKDAALVLDEAIQYLRSLKVKARALGTSTTFN